jgi:C1A family cysteine protease
MNRKQSLGWHAPTLEQQVRALRYAHPEAGDGVLSNVTAAPTGDLSQYTCDLDQGNLGSCQSNGPAQAFYVAMMVAVANGLIAVNAFVLARLWLYYGIRYLEGNLNTDAGGNIGDAFRILAAKGVPNESSYPYDISRFKEWPGPELDREAFDSKGAVGANYHPIGSTGSALITDVEKAITAKMAVVFGCLVSEEFCSSQPSGIIQAPKSQSDVAGGHCMTVVGYDHAAKKLKVKNSWGASWSDPTAGPGCFWMSYSWFTDSTYGASDCWIVQAVPQGVGK